MKTLTTLILLTTTLAMPAALAGPAPAGVDTDSAIREQGLRALAAINDELRDNLRPARRELALRHAVHAVRVATAAAPDAATARAGI